MYIREGFPGQRSVVLPRMVVQHAHRQPLTCHLVLTDIGFFPKAAWHYVERPTGSPQMILIYCLRGSGFVELRNERLKVQAGEVLVLPPGEPHRYGADEFTPWTIYWCHTSGTEVATYQRLLGMDENRFVFFLGDDPGAIVLFDEAIQTLLCGYGQPHLTAASLCIGHLFGRMIESSKDRHRRIRDMQERIEQVVTILRQRLAGTVRLPELAKIANLSTSHFSAVFKRKMGYPPLEYFLRLKMQRAADLLDSTQSPVKSIAVGLGFDDPLYFTRRFTAIHGCSPTQYRAIRKG